LAAYPTTQQQGGLLRKKPYPATAPGYAGQPRAAAMVQPQTPALPAKAGSAIPTLTPQVVRASGAGGVSDPQLATWQAIAQSGLGQTNPDVAKFIAQAIQGGNPAALQAFGVPQTQAAVQQQGQTFSPDALNSLMAAAQGAGTGSVQPSTFNLGSLLQAAQALQGAGGGSIPLQQTFFQSPDAVKNLTQQAMQILQPYVQAQTQTAQTAYGQALQQLQNEWANRGLLASGAAAGAEAEGAQQLANTLAQIQGQAAQQALQTGMQYGQLGSQEGAQLFSEQQANQQFALQRAYDYLQSLMQGAQLEQSGNEFQAAQQAAAAQNAVGNYLQGLGFQNQVQQENIANAMALSQLFGIPVQPASTGAGLFGQIPQGMPTLAATQTIADLTGQTPAGSLGGGGQPTLTYQNLLAGLTGRIPQGLPGAGAPTLEAQQFAQQLALQQQSLAASQAANDTLKTQQAIQFLLDAAKTTGQVTPEMASIFQAAGLPIQAGAFGSGSTSGTVSANEFSTDVSTAQSLISQAANTKAVDDTVGKIQQYALTMRSSGAWSPSQYNSFMQYVQKMAAQQKSQLQSASSGPSSIIRWLQSFGQGQNSTSTTGGAGSTGDQK
jgi:hypothetical protein